MMKWLVSLLLILSGYVWTWFALEDIVVELIPAALVLIGIVWFGFNLSYLKEAQ